MAPLKLNAYQIGVHWFQPSLLPAQKAFVLYLSQRRYASPSAHFELMFPDDQIFIELVLPRIVFPKIVVNWILTGFKPTEWEDFCKLPLAINLNRNLATIYGIWAPPREEESNLSPFGRWACLQEERAIDTGNANLPLKYRQKLEASISPIG